MIKYKLKIKDIIEEAQGTKTYYFEKPKDFTWEAGAHTHIAHVGFDEGEKPNRNWVRHMSIMTLPQENKIGITTRVPGSSSEYKQKLSKLNVGDEVVLFKLGSRMGLRRCDRPIILLSMGVGIATMRPLIHSFINDKTGVPYLINVNVDSSGNYIFKDELDKLTDESYKNYWINSRQDFYERLQQLTERQNAIYYIVGSEMFLKDIIHQLLLKKVKAEDIVIDKKDEVLKDYFE
ncbi:FAD-dependent oxidoreductase [Clostridium thermarum]|uniref:FAD-dependent oxidoreductase n=1 Tax=Clostridium thermarum TaxID=1716543 RepID=UPI0013D4D1C2|nr:FAD-dependent oxidoreductase [Clostridium thermarum]